MKTVRMLRTGPHPVLGGLFEPVRQRFAESQQYQLLSDDSIEPADVILAFMPDTFQQGRERVGLAGVMKWVEVEIDDGLFRKTVVCSRRD